MRCPLEPVPVFAAPVQIFLEHLPIQHERDGRVAVLHFQLQVGEGSGLFFGAQCRRETAVRLTTA